MSIYHSAQIKVYVVEYIYGEENGWKFKSFPPEFKKGRDGNIAGDIIECREHFPKAVGTRLIKLLLKNGPNTMNPIVNKI